MINHNNYYDKIKNIDFYNLPDALMKGHEYVNKATNNGASWEAYHGSDAIKKVVDMYFSKLNEYSANNYKAEIKTGFNICGEGFINQIRIQRQ